MYIVCFLLSFALVQGEYGYIQTISLDEDSRREYSASADGSILVTQSTWIDL